MRKGESHKVWNILKLVLLYGILAFLAMNKQSKAPQYYYQGEIWADKAGYFVHIPATFIYGYQADLFPDSVDFKTGQGFHLNRATNKVETKYPVGVAVLQSPFWLVAHAFEKARNGNADGFSKSYHKSINFAAAFYAFLGLIFSFKFLRLYFDAYISNFSIITLFFASNILYYAIDETGMSHIYSFALFAIAAYLYKRIISYRTKSKEYLLFYFVASLIVLVRPFNVIFLVFLFFLDISDFRGLKKRVMMSFTVSNIVIFSIIFLLTMIPQLVYWHYETGKWIVYSYQGEGFDNWKSPMFFHYLFAPLNGLFIYNPFFVFILIGIGWMIRLKQKNGVLIGVLLVSIVYLFSSWWAWYFGCGLGSRTMVEYYVLLAIPFTHFIKRIHEKREIIRRIIFSMLFIFIVLNIKLTYNFDECFFGKNPWDYQEVLKLILK